MNKDERVELLGSKLTKTDRTERLWVKGAFEELQIFRAPTELLYLNDDNRRFRTEGQHVAAQLGRRLDPTGNPEDEQSIISLLLDKEPWAIEGDRVVGRPSKDTAALLNDWEARGQEKPLWIRPDGLVTNGNRRLAMIKREQAQRGEFGEWVEVVVFPETDYDDDVLFDLEAREQLTEGFKKRYSDINMLLTLRDAADLEHIDWDDPASLKATAARIQHLVSSGESYAETQLYAIKYMDLFLEYVEWPDQYHLLQGMVERFREVGKTMKGVRDDDASREDSMLVMLFAGIQTQVTHDDIRDLRKLLKTDPEKFDEVASDVQELEEEAEEETAEEPEPEVGDEDDLDEEDPRPRQAPTAPRYPKRAVKRTLRLAVQGVRDAKDDDRAGSIQLAAQRLVSIDPQELVPILDDGAAGTRLRTAVDTIITWAEAAEQALGGSGQQ